MTIETTRTDDYVIADSSVSVVADCEGRAAPQYTFWLSVKETRRCICVISVHFECNLCAGDNSYQV